MKSRTFTTNAWILPLLLVMMCVLVACQSIPSILTGETDAAATVGSIAADVCRAWKPTTYSSRDTSETQTGNRANNASRDSYCGKAP